MGYSPILWGKQAWHFIHFVALNFPENPTQRDKDIYTEFIYSLPQVLPCPICGSHFVDFLTENEPKLSDRTSFFNWTVDAHNNVNRRNGKAELSYEQAYSEVMNNANMNSADNQEAISERLKLLANKIKRK